MHAWNQQIEPVAHTARDITAAAMARVVSHAPHHLRSPGAAARRRCLVARWCWCCCCRRPPSPCGRARCAGGELCPWRSTIDMKIMDAWHQRIEPVHTRHGTALQQLWQESCPMTRTTSTVGRHAVRGVGSASKARRLVLLRNRCSPITALFDDCEHGCRYACMSPILPGKSAPGDTLHFFFRCAGLLQ